jgi:hypothetical protein
MEAFKTQFSLVDDFGKVKQGFKKLLLLGTGGSRL